MNCLLRIKMEKGVQTETQTGEEMAAGVQINGHADTSANDDTNFQSGGSVVDLPRSTKDLASQLFKLHNINVTSFVVLSRSLELVGSNGIGDSTELVVLVKKLMQQATFNYTSIVFEGRNWFIIPKDEFVFVFRGE